MSGSTVMGKSVKCCCGLIAVSRKRLTLTCPEASVAVATRADICFSPFLVMRLTRIRRGPTRIRTKTYVKYGLHVVRVTDTRTADIEETPRVVGLLGFDIAEE